MRRTLLLLLVALPGLPAVLTAQQSAGWSLGLGGAFTTFKGGSNIPAIDAENRPHDRMSYDVTLSRRGGGWEFSLEAGVAPGHLRVDGAPLTLDDRTTAVDRFRVGLLAARPIARPGSGELLVLAGPVLDGWSPEGGEHHAAVGGQAGLGLRIPLGGRLSLENRSLAALTGSPFAAADMPVGQERKALWSYAIGAGVRIKL